MLEALRKFRPMKVEVSPVVFYFQTEKKIKQKTKTLTAIESKANDGA